MSKTSGFRAIEFKEKVCDYRDIGFDETKYCNSGIIYIYKYTSILKTPISYSTNIVCKKCNGTGTINKVESKLE